MSESLCELGDILAAAARAVGSSAALAAYDGRDGLDDLACGKFRREIRAHCRNQRDSAIAAAAENDDAAVLALERVCRRLERIAVHRARSAMMAGVLPMVTEAARRSLALEAASRWLAALRAFSSSFWWASMASSFFSSSPMGELSFSAKCHDAMGVADRMVKSFQSGYGLDTPHAGRDGRLAEDCGKGRSRPWHAYACRRRAHGVTVEPLGSAADLHHADAVAVLVAKDLHHVGAIFSRRRRPRRSS